MKSTTRLQPLPTLDKPKETNMSSTNIYIPYTYLLFHKKSRTFYYGSRTAKNCHPSDLFESYFSSSNVVKSIIKKEGKDAFLFRVDKTFETAEETLDYEYDVLERYKAGTNERFLNLTHSKSGCMWTPEVRKKASETHKRRVREGTHKTAFKKGQAPTKGFTGGKHTEESILKIKRLGEDHHYYGKKRDKKTCKKISDSVKKIMTTNHRSLLSEKAKARCDEAFRKRTSENNKRQVCCIKCGYQVNLSNLTNHQKGSKCKN